MATAAANNEEVRLWDHLRGVTPCKTPSNMELLIGLDVPQAFIPLEVRTGSHREPFAISTPLRWTVNGSIRNDGDDLSDSFENNRGRMFTFTSRLENVSKKV